MAKIRVFILQPEYPLLIDGSNLLMSFKKCSNNTLYIIIHPVVIGQDLCSLGKVEFV